MDASFATQNYLDREEEARAEFVEAIGIRLGATKYRLDRLQANAVGRWAVTRCVREIMLARENGLTPGELEAKYDTYAMLCVEMQVSQTLNSHSIMTLKLGNNMTKIPVNYDYWNKHDGAYFTVNDVFAMAKYEGLLRVALPVGAKSGTATACMLTQDSMAVTRDGQTDSAQQRSIKLAYISTQKNDVCISYLSPNEEPVWEELDDAIVARLIIIQMVAVAMHCSIEASHRFARLEYSMTRTTMGVQNSHITEGATGGTTYETSYNVSSASTTTALKINYNKRGEMPVSVKGVSKETYAVLWACSSITVCGHNVWDETGVSLDIPKPSGVTGTLDIWAAIAEVSSTLDTDMAVGQVVAAAMMYARVQPQSDEGLVEKLQKHVELRVPRNKGPHSLKVRQNEFTSSLELHEIALGCVLAYEMTYSRLLNQASVQTSVRVNEMSKHHDMLCNALYGMKDVTKSDGISLSALVAMNCYDNSKDTPANKLLHNVFIPHVYVTQDENTSTLLPQTVEKTSTLEKQNTSAAVQLRTAIKKNIRKVMRTMHNGTFESEHTYRSMKTNEMHANMAAVRPTAMAFSSAISHLDSLSTTEHSNMASLTVKDGYVDVRLCDMTVVTTVLRRLAQEMIINDFWVAGITSNRFEYAFHTQDCSTQRFKLRGTSNALSTETKNGALYKLARSMQTHARNGEQMQVSIGMEAIALKGMSGVIPTPMYWFGLHQPATMKRLTCSLLCSAERGLPINEVPVVIRSRTATRGMYERGGLVKLYHSQKKLEWQRTLVGGFGSGNKYQVISLAQTFNRKINQLRNEGCWQPPMVANVVFSNLRHLYSDVTPANLGVSDKFMSDCMTVSEERGKQLGTTAERAMWVAALGLAMLSVKEVLVEEHEHDLTTTERASLQLACRLPIMLPDVGEEDLTLIAWGFMTEQVVDRPYERAAVLARLVRMYEPAKWATTQSDDKYGILQSISNANFSRRQSPACAKTGKLCTVRCALKPGVTAHKCHKCKAMIECDICSYINAVHAFRAEASEDDVETPLVEDYEPEPGDEEILAALKEGLLSHENMKPAADSRWDDEVGEDRNSVTDFLLETRIKDTLETGMGGAGFTDSIRDSLSSSSSVATAGSSTPIDVALDSIVAHTETNTVTGTLTETGPPHATRIPQPVVVTEKHKRKRSVSPAKKPIHKKNVSWAAEPFSIPIISARKQATNSYEPEKLPTSHIVGKFIWDMDQRALHNMVLWEPPYPTMPVPRVQIEPLDESKTLQLSSKNNAFTRFSITSTEYQKHEADYKRKCGCAGCKSMASAKDGYTDMVAMCGGKPWHRGLNEYLLSRAEHENARLSSAASTSIVLNATRYLEGVTRTGDVFCTRVIPWAMHFGLPATDVTWQIMADTNAIPAITVRGESDYGSVPVPSTGMYQIDGRKAKNICHPKHMLVCSGHTKGEAYLTYKDSIDVMDPRELEVQVKCAEDVHVETMSGRSLDALISIAPWMYPECGAQEHENNMRVNGATIGDMHHYAMSMTKSGGILIVIERTCSAHKKQEQNETMMVRSHQVVENYADAFHE